MNIRLLLRLKRLAQHAPSKKRIIMILAILGVCTVLFIYERNFGWPEWLTVNSGGSRRGFSLR